MTAQAASQESASLSREEEQAEVIRRLEEDIIFGRFAPGSRLVAADLVLQRAAVRKHASRRTRGFRISMGAPVPRRAFRPPPQVDSAVLVVRRL